MVPVVVFLLDEQRHAVPMEAVERVTRAVLITPLARAPRIVSGVIDVHGTIVPVLDLRARLGLRDKRVELSDCLVIARAGARTVALVADSVIGAEQVHEADLEAGESVTSWLPGASGLARTPDGMVVIQDLDRFFSLDEELALDDALAG